MGQCRNSEADALYLVGEGDMDDTTRQIVNIAAANLPALIQAAQDLVAAVNSMAAQAGMNPGEIETLWRAARQKGLSQDPAELPDAVA